MDTFQCKLMVMMMVIGGGALLLLLIETEIFVTSGAAGAHRQRGGGGIGASTSAGCIQVTENDLPNRDETLPMVDEMFVFVDNSQDMIDGRSYAPSAFQVSDFVSLCETHIT